LNLFDEIIDESNKSKFCRIFCELANEMSLPIWLPYHIKNRQSHLFSLERQRHKILPSIDATFSNPKLKGAVIFYWSFISDF